VRESLISKGYSCPLLTEMCLRLRDYLLEKGIEFDDEEIQDLYDEIEKRESLINAASFKFWEGNDCQSKIQLVKHKHKDDKKHYKMKSKGIFGFVKCLAGGLICIIPIPAAQAIGAGLVLNGINDIIDDARETGDENERLQRMDEQRRQEALLLTPNS